MEEWEERVEKRVGIWFVLWVGSQVYERTVSDSANDSTNDLSWNVNSRHTFMENNRTKLRFESWLVRSYGDCAAFHHMPI